MALVNDKDFPGAAQSNASYALVNPMDIYQTEIYEKSVRRVPYMSSLSWLKHLDGRMQKRKVTRSVYSFYEEGQFMKGAATIAAIATSGATFNITLSAADHTSVGGANATSFVVERMSCLFADGKTTGYVNSVDRSVAGAHVVNVKKWNPSQDIATVATVGSPIVFFSNIQPERSTQTESRVPQYEKVSNYLQIVRESFNTSDVEVQNKMWFKTESGKQYLYYDGIDQTAQRFEFQKEAAMLVTPQASGLTDKNANALTSLCGLTPQIDQNGINLEYFEEPDGESFDELILALDNNFGETSYIVGHGLNVMVKLAHYLKTFGQNGTGNLSFSPFQGGEEQAISLKFKSYSVGAYEFYFQNWSILTHKDSLGAKGLPYRHMAFFIPAGVTKNVDPFKVAETTNYSPYMTMVSPEWGVNSNIDKGEYLMWETGAMGSNGPTSDVLEKVVHMVGYIGFEMKCRNKFAKWEMA